MKRQVLFFSIFAAAAFAVPAFAADGAAGMVGLRFGKNTFNFEGMPSGPQPLTNLSRRPDGTSEAGRLVGDYKNPILTPYAASVVKQKGELAIAGIGIRNAQDQCRAVAPPFTFAMQLGLVMLPAKNGDIAILYDQNANTRHIRMNGRHPEKLVPTPMGDSVGHWEGDTLVIDTVGVKVDDYISVDRYGTPQSEAMHVIERYRLIDGAQAKAAVDAFREREGTVGGGGRNGGGRDAGYHPDTNLKGLQLDVTMEDPKVFTTPLTARVTYRRLATQWQENVCADNPMEHYKDEWIGLPRAETPDF
jgi:hypothetical protein